MDVQQAGGGADGGPGPAGQESSSRVGLIVGLGIALLVALVVIVVLLLRSPDADDEAAATTPAASPTQEATPTATSEPSPTSTPSPTTEPEADVPELRADGIGPLSLRMTAEEALATGLVTQETVELMTVLVADQDEFPGLLIGYDEQEDLITSFTVKDGSPIRTPDGIGVDSTPDDIRAAYGPLVQEQVDPNLGETWFLVPVDDVGYAFFPTEEELVMVAATDTVLLTIGPGQDL